MHRGLRVLRESRSFVLPNGDVDEYLSFVLRNPGAEPIVLEGGPPFEFFFTDSASLFRAAGDGLAVPLCVRSSSRDGDTFLLAPYGAVPPRGERTLGIHVRRPGRAVVRTEHNWYG